MLLESTVSSMQNALPTGATVELVDNKFSTVGFAASGSRGMRRVLLQEAQSVGTYKLTAPPGAPVCVVCVWQAHDLCAYVLDPCLFLVYPLFVWGIPAPSHPVLVAVGRGLAAKCVHTHLPTPCQVSCHAHAMLTSILAFHIAETLQSSWDSEVVSLVAEMGDDQFFFGDLEGATGVISFQAQIVDGGDEVDGDDDGAATTHRCLWSCVVAALAAAALILTL